MEVKFIEWTNEDDGLQIFRRVGICCIKWNIA